MPHTRDLNRGWIYAMREKGRLTTEMSVHVLSGTKAGLAQELRLHLSSFIVWRLVGAFSSKIKAAKETDTEWRQRRRTLSSCPSHRIRHLQVQGKSWCFQQKWPSSLLKSYLGNCENCHPRGSSVIFCKARGRLAVYWTGLQLPKCLSPQRKGK